METFNAHFDGKYLVPDEPVDFVVGQPLRVRAEAAEPRSPRPTEELLSPVITGADPELVRWVATAPELELENLK